MKRSILCLLVLLTLCLCILFVSCKQEDPGKNDPDASEIGKEGVIETEKIQETPDFIPPENAETNQRQDGFTNRYD
jgi:hypothetical protein